MKSYTVGDLKRDFSVVMEAVRRGEEVAVTHGRKRTKVAVIVPYQRYAEPQGDRPLGILKGRARCRIGADFGVTDEELAGK